MKTKWKVTIGIVALLVVVGLVIASVKVSLRGVVTVQTSKIVREDLVSIVTASGEIKPKNYVDIGAYAVGQLSSITVKEGDRVKKGQLLARIENTEPEADVNAQKAALSSAEADAAASEASYKAGEDNMATMQAGVDRAKSDLDKAKMDNDRYQQLYSQKLIAKQD